MAAAYYNEHDPFAAAWLRELIKANLIAPGDVDERDIQEVNASDVRGYTQAHFFAGIGGWSYALRLAGWPDDRPVWTGSCPCQPFSAAGKGASADDPRHLWPTWIRLIRECRPDTIFGEQVASVDGLAWFDLVSTDLEGTGYAIGAVDLGAASVGAPHIRQRLWFVADAGGDGPQWRRGAADRVETNAWGEAALWSLDRIDAQEHGPLGSVAQSEVMRYEGRRLRADRESAQRTSQDGMVSGMAESLHPERRAQHGPGEDVGHGQDPGREETHSESGACGEVRQLGHTERGRCESGHTHGTRADELRPARDAGFWRDCDLIPCGDGKARPVEPGTFPLAHGVPARVGRLRGYGNAIVPQVAAEVIRAYMECYSDGGWR